MLLIGGGIEMPRKRAPSRVAESPAKRARSRLRAPSPIAERPAKWARRGSARAKAEDAFRDRGAEGVAVRQTVNAVGRSPFGKGESRRQLDPQLEWMYDPDTRDTDIDRGIPWRANKAAVAYARELLGAQLQPIMVDVAKAGEAKQLSDEHGVELLELKSVLVGYEFPDNSQHFSRRCVRLVWDEIALWTFPKGKKLDCHHRYARHRQVAVDHVWAE